MVMSRLKRLRSLVLELPQQLRLAYCLARDPRTPPAPKAALGAALAVIVNPLIDIPMWVPVLGQMDTISLTVLAVRTFNSQVPEELRQEVEESIRQGHSTFDTDLARGVGAARHLARERVRHQLGHDTLHGASLEQFDHEVGEGDLAIQCMIKGPRVRKFKDFDPLPVPDAVVRLS